MGQLGVVIYGARLYLGCASAVTVIRIDPGRPTPLAGPISFVRPPRSLRQWQRRLGAITASPGGARNAVIQILHEQALRGWQRRGRPPPLSKFPFSPKFLPIIALLPFPFRQHQRERREKRADRPGPSHPFFPSSHRKDLSFPPFARFAASLGWRERVKNLAFGVWSHHQLKNPPWRRPQSEIPLTPSQAHGLNSLFPSRGARWTWWIIPGFLGFVLPVKIFSASPPIPPTLLLSPERDLAFLRSRAVSRRNWRAGDLNLPFACVPSSKIPLLLGPCPGWVVLGFVLHRREMTQGGAEFHLPDEILAVIPTDPYDQLDLARKITSMAIASRVSRLEGETGRLRQMVTEKDRVIAELQERLEELDRMFQEADARLRTSLEENIKLTKERDSLALTAKKLSRELLKPGSGWENQNWFSDQQGPVLILVLVPTPLGLVPAGSSSVQLVLTFDYHAISGNQSTSKTWMGVQAKQRYLVDSATKIPITDIPTASVMDVAASRLAASLGLEAFKRNLMQSLNEDDSSHTETVDIGTCDQFVPKDSIWKDGGSVSHTASNYVTASTDTGNVYKEGSRNVGQKFSMTSYISPRLTPSATPKVTSTAGSPRGFSAAGSPKLLSGATSPTKFRIEGHTALSPWYPSSQRSSAANSPPRGRSLPGRTPRIDGKEFFRQARSRLSYEQFGAFLANIKELNAHRQSREETLKKAEEIFGTDNKDLFLSFQGLLNRNIP
ncbi:hypothetical protein Taro_053365 [Colocasia esculenta]|uniref:At4g15545-like C-terminal domain-containing protein n=1 Tax=Colocasia esculenta TaxID=4460 RepID=A0A843XMY2_COLES|nr:hypothetical protein [Colocasia esculenta]